MPAQPKRSRQAPIEIQPEEFRALGYQLIDRITEFMTELPQKPVSLDTTPAQLRAVLGETSLPEHGQDPASLLNRAADLLFDNSVHLGHPRFWGYIAGTPAPIGSLGDLLAAAVNPNVGGWMLSPMATEIEAQTIRWLGELIGYGSNCSGLLVSGGSMANLVPFLVARKAKTPWLVREGGLLAGEGRQLRVYTSNQTHSWVQKAADMFGLGTDAIRWIPTDDRLRMDTTILRHQIEADLARGDVPFMVIGTAGSTGVGAVDPLPEIAAICRKHDLWFHVDGAYGAAAAALGEAGPSEFAALAEADSIALDPHKWLYVPLEAGAVLVRDASLLVDTFAYHPDFFLEPGDKIHYHEYGPQTSRGFRALKVWLALQQVGRQGYQQMIAEDIHLAKTLYQQAQAHPELEACTHSLSITTFRYVPHDLQAGDEATETYLNALNEALVEQFHASPDAFLSNAVVNGKYVMRMCIVNFRTSIEDIEALPHIVLAAGRQLDKQLRPAHLF
ncbi:MAG: aspartate aminotransferase family protein [Anaerolineae bacterium]|nr:aspartate aminotransferase family protein [Anaerolineae bacterium]